MISYDYCHFEVVLGYDEEITLEQVNELRKDAQRLADEAVRQYKKAKTKAKPNMYFNVEQYRTKARAIKENFAKSEWTEEQKGTVKALEDYEWELNNPYDYDDDWEREVRELNAE